MHIIVTTHTPKTEKPPTHRLLDNHKKAHGTPVPVAGKSDQDVWPRQYSRKHTVHSCNGIRRLVPRGTSHRTWRTISLLSSGRSYFKISGKTDRNDHEEVSRGAIRFYLVGELAESAYKHLKQDTTTTSNAWEWVSLLIEVETFYSYCAFGFERKGLPQTPVPLPSLPLRSTPKYNHRHFLESFGVTLA